MSLALLFQPWRWKKGKELGLLKNEIATLPPVARNDVDIRLFYKGRQAIAEALRMLKIGTGDEVIVQAFTCVAVVRPILEAGATPIYVDVAPRSLNPLLSSIKAVITPKTKAIILQHTLGFINSENEKIVSWCKQKGISVIQDLAHALDKVRPSGVGPWEANTFYVLSFSQDKVVDAISGGALITPRLNDLNHLTFRHIDNFTIAKNLVYPVCTWLVRSTYQFGIGRLTVGKVIHWLAKTVGLMNSPIEGGCAPAKMPNAFAALAINQFKRLENIADHRRKIALLYNESLNSELKIVSKNEIAAGANLRYPIWVNNRDELEDKLKTKGVYLVDHWYDAAVSPEWVEPDKVKYRPGSCPNAEELAKHIFNLPTHVNISESKAKELAVLINQYAKNL